LVEWQKAILAPVWQALRDHPVLESLQVEGLSEALESTPCCGNSQLKQFTIARFKVLCWGANGLALSLSC
jgi:hypothetical protein